jgi:hypothetical protein
MDILRDMREMKRTNGIIENATISYKDGNKILEKAIRITKKGIYLCHMYSTNSMVKRFNDHSFVPLDQIERISFCNDKGRTQDIDLKKI